jgi:hypothetical protein
MPLQYRKSAYKKCYKKDNYNNNVTKRTLVLQKGYLCYSKDTYVTKRTLMLLKGHLCY